MEKEVVLDLSGLDWKLKHVRVYLAGLWWKAQVEIGERTVVGEGWTAVEALANLVSSGLLWDKLGERLVKEG